MSKILAVTTNYGVEFSELTVPVNSLKEAGNTVTVASPAGGEVKTLIFDVKPGDSVESDAKLSEVNPADYDILLIPGGTINADQARMDSDIMRILKSFVENGKVVATICHAAWSLVSAKVTKGKTLTSYESVALDVKNSGGNWIDEPVVVDKNNGWTLISSRTPDDLDQFVTAIKEEI